MDGFEVCHAPEGRQETWYPFRSFLLSAQNDAEDKERAFRAGGADYITKPVQFEEVQGRVGTQSGLQRARRAERDLLESTLKGAVRTLADPIHRTGPALIVRSGAIRNMVVDLAAKLALDEIWQYE
jgi:PleD family two-component response regulator